VLLDGTNVHADVIHDHLNFYVPLALERDGRMVGISGNGDGDDGNNDFVTLEGVQLASPPPFEQLYNDFAASWRVTDETTLFDYQEGQSSETFWKPEVPKERITLADLSAEQRARAEFACREAGLRSGPPLDDCIFDYALTGEKEFLDSALSQQPPIDFAFDPDQLEIELPSQAFAALQVALKLFGPVERNYWLGFAPKGSPNKAKLNTPYSDTVLSGTEEEVQLIVPMTPGEYEVRYRELRGEAQIARKIPFTVLEPELSISAPASAPAGGSVDYKIAGDVGQYAKLTVVPADGNGDKRLQRIHLRQGTEQSGTITHLPEEPGQYEIRCISGYGTPPLVYARQPIELYEAN
jgi:hypothetical protein